MHAPIKKEVAPCVVIHSRYIVKELGAGSKCRNMCIYYTMISVKNARRIEPCVSVCVCVCNSRTIQKKPLAEVASEEKAGDLVGQNGRETNSSLSDPF